MSASLTPDFTNSTVLAQLFAPAAHEKTIGLAVSGGADSLALMILAHRWAQSAPHTPKLIVYSLDHDLRPEAAAEVEMVLREAARLGLTARALKWTGEKPETGISEAARAARYGIIGAAMIEDGATLLLTAHHRSDQAETVLMRLAHGSGIEGLRGMAARSQVEGITVFRPLLEIDPKHLIALVKQEAMTAVQDPTNEDTSYERVRWRKLLPALAAEGLDGAALSRFAQRMAETDLAIGQMADAAFDELVDLDGFGAATISRDAFTALSPAIGRRMLSRVLTIVGGRQKPRALGQVDRLYDSIIANTLQRAATALGAVARVREKTLVISREPGRTLPADALLEPSGVLTWDERFLYANLSTDKRFTASVSEFLPRHRIETVLGAKVTAPSEAIRTTPILRDEAGNVVALGGWSFDDRIKVEILVD
ncbi:tRNA lysidine(34) synthetase TilS [Devosia sp. MC532]|uniref:tRNA lysidine(34) synthetase TilS n=1 Tax=Devosia sp. MC532 TaxID=2799788 RepID=UPI0018F5604D|nr:tRNA lysidine(34) synthetase TilS [Devosia sp. MC532]MBJ7578494.1 tRNA lysidine(34) synthetase TilS [Devosia sp. MC532]